MLSRTSGLAIQQNLIKNISESQVNLANAQDRVSSGNAVSSFAELSATGNTERVLVFNSQLDRIDGYLENNNRVISRLSAMDNALSQLQQLATDWRDSLTVRRSSSGESAQIDILGTAQIDIAIDNLNLKFEGRYLFAGSRTDTKPVDTSETGTNIVNDAPSANYYMGDSTTVAVRANDELTQPYGIKADEVGFQNLLASYNLGIEGDQENSDTKLSSAVDFINVAIEEISQLRAQIGNNMRILEDANTLHQETKLNLNSTVSGITETDIPTELITLSTEQAKLQASFQVFARLERLSLTNFL